MNKKQLIVAWVMGIILFVVWGLIFSNYGEITIHFAASRESISSPINLLFFLSYPILIIGSLLIYTLRDKKK